MKIEMLPSERWWGGIVDFGRKMPWDETSCVTLDPTSMGEDQRSAVYLSSHGRCLWSDTPFTLTFQNGFLEMDMDVHLEQGAPSLKGAHAAMWKRLCPESRIPDRRVFMVPQYNTWMELTYGQEQKRILEYAHAIVDNGMTPGILMIDEGWSEDYGVYDFYPGRFLDPGAMVRELHELGFVVMLWITPYISPDSNTFRSLRNTDLLLRDREGRFALREWWNGFSCVLDLSNPEAGAWLREKLVWLQEAYGIDGFKFDGGDPGMYRADDQRANPRMPLGCTADYGEFAAMWPFNELRAAWNQGGRALVCRLHDKLHAWDARGLGAVIPGMIAQGLLGYYYGCPDMIGGGDYASLLEDSDLDQELYIRWLEASLLCPMIQFSLAPWRILSPENFEIVRKLLALRERYTPYILAAAENAARNHEPILRSLEYEFPGQGYEREQSMYLLGESHLLVPMLEKGGRERIVRLPRGQWRESDGALYSGGTEVRLTYPLDKVYIFEKLPII